MRMPGRRGERKRKLLSEMFGDGKAVGAESGERADSAAKLEDEGAFVEGKKPVAITEERVEPARDD